MLEIYHGDLGKTQRRLLTKTWCWCVGTSICLRKLILNLIIAATSKFIALKSMLSVTIFFWNKFENNHMLQVRDLERLRWVGKREMQVVSSDTTSCPSHNLRLLFGWWFLADKPQCVKVDPVQAGKLLMHTWLGTRRLLSLLEDSCYESTRDGMWLQ